MTRLNTSYQTRKNLLVTYGSGGRETQIDCIMLRKEHASECRDCTVLPSEAITTQHRILIADLVVEKTRRMRAAGTKRIRWRKREIPDKSSGKTTKHINEVTTNEVEL